MLSQGNPPQPSGLVTPGMIQMWWSSNSRETLLVLQCLIYYSESRHSLDSDDFLEILGTCGHLSFDLEETFYSVGHLQTALLVQLIQSKEKFNSFRSKSVDIEEQLERISNRSEYSLLLLAWMLFNYTSDVDPIDSKFQQLGEKTVEQRVMKIIGDIGNELIFQGKSPFREIVCKAMNDLLSVLVKSFDTERLASPADLRMAACSVLRGSSRAAKSVWLHDEGINIVLNETLSQFPLDMIALLDLSKAIAQSSNENKIKICQDVLELPYFVEPIDAVPESSLKWTAAGVVVLLQTHYPCRNADYIEVLIPRGAMGSFDGKCIRWQVIINLYDVAVGEIQLLLQQASYGLSAVRLDTLTNVQHVLGFLELMMPQLESLLPTQAQRLRQFVLALVERFGPLAGSTYELLASCLNCLAAAVTKSNACEVAGKLFGASVLPSLERQGQSRS